MVKLVLISAVGLSLGWFLRGHVNAGKLTTGVTVKLAEVESRGPAAGHPADAATSNETEVEDIPQLPLGTLPRQGCLTNGAGGEVCYFRDVMVCVGLGDKQKVAIVAPAGHAVWHDMKGEKGRGHPLVDERYGQQLPFIPRGFKIGVDKEAPYIGTDPRKRWPDQVLARVCGAA